MDDAGARYRLALDVGQHVRRRWLAKAIRRRGSPNDFKPARAAADRRKPANTVGGDMKVSENTLGHASAATARRLIVMAELDQVDVDVVVRRLTRKTDGLVGMVWGWGTPGGRRLMVFRADDLQ